MKLWLKKQNQNDEFNKLFNCNKTLENTEFILKNRIIKETEFIFNVYRKINNSLTKVGSNEEQLKNLLYDLQIIHSHNNLSKIENGFTKLFKNLIDDLHLEETNIKLICIELILMNKKAKIPNVIHQLIEKIGISMMNDDLISKFIQLFHLRNHIKRNNENRLSPKNKRNKNCSPIISQYQIPKINSNANVLSAKREKRILVSKDRYNIMNTVTFNGDFSKEKVKDIIIYSGNDKLSARSISTKQITSSRYELFQIQEKERKDKINKMKNEIREKEIKKCNFFPIILKDSKQILNNRLKNTNQNIISKMIKSLQNTEHNKSLEKELSLSYMNLTSTNFNLNSKENEISNFT